ncbi:MAG: F0F1 ATP synthase subunit epsilon [Candidatus Lernaella stagnicola]|nr:F0F1 ATP synthase subunit epsilon [Candidatus Lernaella stagnicola]
MADTLIVKVVTPAQKLYDGEAGSIVAPGKQGEFGILPGHDPWLVALGMGPLHIQNAKGESWAFFLNGGYCRIDDNHVEVLAETCESADKIDMERAAAAKGRAEERIKASAKDEDVDMMRAEAALRRALYRLEVAGK